MANPADLLDNQDASDFINQSRSVAASTANTDPPATPDAGATDEQSEKGVHYQACHQRLTRARTVVEVNKAVADFSRDINLTEEQRQALRERGKKKRGLFNDRRIVLLMDNINRATHLDRLDMIETETQAVIAELGDDDMAEPINLALKQREDTINRFRMVGWCIAVPLLALLAIGFISSVVWHNEKPMALISSLAFAGFLAACAVPHYYRTSRAKRGFMLNWTRVIGHGWISKGFVLLWLIIWAIAALTTKGW